VGQGADLPLETEPIEASIAAWPQRYERSKKTIIFVARIPSNILKARSSEMNSDIPTVTANAGPPTGEAGD